MPYQRSPGIQELLFLRAKFNDLVDSLVEAETELPSASDPSGYFPPPRLEIPKIVALCEQVQALLGGPSYTLEAAFLVSPSLFVLVVDSHTNLTRGPFCDDSFTFRAVSVSRSSHTSKKRCGKPQNKASMLYTSKSSQRAVRFVRKN